MFFFNTVLFGSTHRMGRVNNEKIRGPEEIYERNQSIISSDKKPGPWASSTYRRLSVTRPQLKIMSRCTAVSSDVLALVHTGAQAWKLQPTGAER